MQKGERYKIYDKVISIHGKDRQTAAWIEELNELSQVLCKRLCGKKYKKADLLDEVVDVYIILDQILKDQELDNIRIQELMHIKLLQLDLKY